jgi:hypothetical protein
LDRRVATGLDRRVRSTYPFAAAFLARLTGLGLVVVGLLALVVVAVAALLPVPAAVLPVGLAVVVAAWAAVLVAVLVLRRADVVRLDEVGYRVRLVRGAGVREARWKDVEDVTAPTVLDQRCVLLRLRDGRTTTIPVEVLRGSPDGFVRELQRHLDAGRGLRPVRPPDGRGPAA